jgi:hypothetical protein
MHTSHKIEIWQYGDDPDTRAGLPPIRRPRLQVTEVDTRVVTEHLKQAIADFQVLMDEPTPASSSFEIDTIELSFGVSGSGSVALIGKLEVGMEAGIKVTLKRKARK